MDKEKKAIQCKMITDEELAKLVAKSSKKAKWFVACEGYAYKIPNLLNMQIEKAGKKTFLTEKGF